MAFIPVTNVVEAQLIYTLNGQNCQNSLYFQYATTVTLSDLNTLGAFLKNWWTTNVASIQSSACGLLRIEMRDLTVENGLVSTYATGLPAYGGVTGDAMPGNVTLAVAFRTNRAGRNYRGRNYFVGLAESQVAGNAVIPAFLASVTAAYQKLLPAATPTPPSTWSVVSRFNNGAPRAAGEAVQVEAVTVDTYVDSQRRRLYGRGA